MFREFNTIYDLTKEKKVDMRTTSYTHALNRICHAIESLGTSRFFSNGMVSK